MKNLIKQDNIIRFHDIAKNGEKHKKSVLQKQELFAFKTFHRPHLQTISSDCFYSTL